MLLPSLGLSLRLFLSAHRFGMPFLVACFALVVPVAALVLEMAVLAATHAFL
jgi:hypothetical protein